MTEQDQKKQTFTELLEEYQNLLPRRGQIVKGEILAKTGDMIILDVGAKRDAIVPPRELARLDDKTIEEFSIGNQLPVYITDTHNQDGELTVSIERGLEQLDWERATAFLENGELLALTVTGYNAGGLLVEFGKLEGFVPNSLISDLPRGLNKPKMESTKAEMVGTTIMVKIIEVSQVKKRFILSARAAHSERRKKRLQELSVGQVVTGTVTNVVDFGAFVDLDGVVGLIHVSKLSWTSVPHPSEVLKTGDQVDVLILDVNVERERVSLDRRVLMPNPWEKFANQFYHDDIVAGTVESVTDYGVFVELTQGVTGLVHTSEMPEDGAETSEDPLHPGDTVQVRILEIHPERERVSLSMRGLPLNDIQDISTE